MSYSNTTIFIINFYLGEMKYFKYDNFNNKFLPKGNGVFIIRELHYSFDTQDY